MDLHVCAGWVAADHRDRLGHERQQTQVHRSWRPRPGKQHHVVDQLAERVDAGDDIVHDWHVGVAGGAAGDEHLHHTFDAGERVAHFVRHDRRHLSDLCEGRLLDQRLFGRFARGDIGADGDVLVRFAALVEERHDRRVDPIEVTVLGAIADLAVPDAPVRNRAP